MSLERPSRVRALSASEIDDASATLAELFLEAVEDGASIGFMGGLDRDRAQRYWQDLAARPNGRAVLVAEDDAGIAGVVIVVPLDDGFQPHRAEIAKLVVHRRARGRGVGAMLMQAAEAEATGMGRSVLTLMTRCGGDSERLYARLGWTRVGVIADDSLKPDGTLCDAAIFRKRVGP